MNRDHSKYPDDENGNALWQLIEEGDNPTQERDIEFSVAFKTEDEAMQFGEHLLFNRQQVLLCDDEESEDYPFHIVVTVAMVPSHEEITDFENLLATYAEDLNGVNNGWGCDVKK